MPRLILCYGDSNTYGYDPRSCLGGRYPESVRWTGLLKKYGWEIRNEGQNGRSIPQSGREINLTVRTLCRVDADILTVMLGSNDLLQTPCPSAAECAGRMERFLTALLHTDDWEKSRKILLVAPPPMVPGTWTHDDDTIDASRHLAQCYKDTARLLNINFVDAGVWGIELAFDGVHFSEIGHLDFAAGINQALSALFFH